MATLGIFLDGKTYAWASDFVSAEQSPKGLRARAAKLVAKVCHQPSAQMPRIDGSAPAILSVVPGQAVVDIAPLFSDAARAAMAFAFELAMRYGHAQIEPVHLFVSSLQDPQIVTLFGRLTLSTSRLEEPLKTRLQSRSLGKPARVSEAVERVLLNAFRQALERGRMRVSMLEVFAASVADDPFLLELLIQNGVPASRFWHMVEWLRLQEHIEERGTGFVLVGRDRELTHLLQLVEVTHSPILLVGSAGVGKAAIIRELAERLGRAVVELDVEPLVGLSDLEASFQTQLIQPDGTLVIATVTPQAYRDHLERTPLGQRFEVVEVEEPDLPTATLVLASKIAAIESEVGGFFPCEALEHVVALSDRYLHREYLPKKAIDVARAVAMHVVHARGREAVVTVDDIFRVVHARV